jgi:hypothetical protein
VKQALVMILSLLLMPSLGFGDSRTGVMGTPHIQVVRDEGSSATRLNNVNTCRLYPPDDWSLTRSGPLVVKEYVVSQGTWGLDRLVTRTMAYESDGKISVQKGDLTIHLGFTPLDLRQVYVKAPLAITMEVNALSLTIENNSTGSLEINWNRVIIVDYERAVHSVIHKGVPLADKDKRMTPSVIASQSRLQDFIFPSDRVIKGQTGWEAKQFFVGVLLPEEPIEVFLALKRDGTDLSVRLFLICTSDDSWRK